MTSTHKYLLIFLGIATVYFLLSQMSTYIFLKKTPPGFTFPLYNMESPYDYNGYLAGITLGKSGSWYFKNPYTSESSSFTVFYIPYILIGKCAAVFHLSPELAYHVSNFIISEFYFLILFFFLKTVLVKTSSAFFASVFSIIATIPPPILFWGNSTGILYNIYWYHLFDAVNRLNSSPHHVLGSAFFLLSLTFFYVSLSERSYRSTFIAGFLGIVTVFIFPPPVLPFIVAAPVFMCISILKSYVSLKKEMMKKCCLFLAILLLATFISWLHIRAGEHNNATAWEIERWNKNTPDFNLNSFLIFFPSLLFGMPFIFSKDTYRDWKKIFILFWALTPLLLLPFASILSLPKIRLLEGIPFVPFGILFVYSRDALGKTKHQWIKYLFTVVLFVTMIPTTFSILFANSNHHLQKPLDPYVQFSPSFWQTVRFVNDNVPKNSVILSDQYTGLILPAFAPVRSYFGHYNLTYNFETKQKNTRRFFANEMDDIQVHTFIKENNIRYIIWGPDEKKFGPKELRYTLLNPIYSAGEYTVYKTLPE